MDTTTDLLRDTATRLFEAELSTAGRRAADQGEWLTGLWTATETAGLPAALLPEDAGGVGLSIAQGLLPLEIAGRFAAPLPLAETMLASWLLSQAGLAVPSGPLTVAPVRAGDALRLHQRDGGWHLSGNVERIPWSRNAAAIAVLAGDDKRDRHFVALVPAGSWHATPDSNLAGEPRDSLRFDCDLPEDAVKPAPAHIGTRELRAGGAAMRSIMMAGAIARVLEMTVQYAGERIQFGRPIAKFQAIQQNLAILAGQAAAAGAAAGIASSAFAPGTGPWHPNLVAIAAAKSRAGEAASIAAAIAHQVFGAIGFTQEHQLHYWTKRLWSWRDEFGHEAEWNAYLGRHLATRGADRFWSEITAAA